MYTLVYTAKHIHTHKHIQPAARGQNVLLRRRTAGRFILRVCVYVCLRSLPQKNACICVSASAPTVAGLVCAGARESAVWCDAVRMAAWRCAELGRGRRRRIAVRDKNKKKQEKLQPAHPLLLYPTQLHSKV